MIPGDPVRMIVTGTAPKSAVEELRKQLGLDKPILVQFVYFLKDAIHGDLGESFFRSKHGAIGESVAGSSSMRMEATKKGVKGLEEIKEGAHERASVTSLIAERFPLTLLLIGFALLIGFTLSLILAIVGSRSEKLGNSIEGITVIIQSLPNFWLAIMFILIFAAKLKILPAVGYIGFSSLILPSSVLALAFLPGAYKTMRDTLNRIQNETFIAYMKARGISKGRVFLHITKHFFSSIVTFLGLQWGPLFGNAIVVEYLFAIQGMGTLFIYAVLQRDYPLIVGGVIVLSALFVTLNLIADIVYGILDPRVREW